MPRDITIRITLRHVAPSAMRIPISRPRADTVCASSPYRPSDAMTQRQRAEHDQQRRLLTAIANGESDDLGHRSDQADRLVGIDLHE